MYAHERYTIGVREGRAQYGEPPRPAEAFPGEEALLDLAAAPTAELETILARFVVLRAWTLEFTGAARPVVDHAVQAAYEHLAALDPEDPEVTVLLSLVGSGTWSVALLEAAAGEAEAAGHRHGARALRQAVHRARWAAAGYPPPTPS
ncbi:MAG: hypothetical protein ACOCVZ_01930 [Gemmatimonadota bacterium]